MTRDDIFANIQSKASFLCVGLDVDIERIPSHLHSEEDPVFAFNKAIIDATKDLVVAYKPNTAFYESLGPEGMISLQKTIEYIPDDIMCIADAKRADIGNTSRMYAKSFFESYKADAITVAPYMGHDSVSPFLEYDGKWCIILGLTSNKGSEDFQHLQLSDGRSLHKAVIKRCSEYGSADQVMFVVGATQAEYIREIRELVPDYFFLVPGVGAQGGDLRSVCAGGMNSKVGLLINSSRSIIYASDGIDFAEAARRKALELQEEMKQILIENSII